MVHTRDVDGRKLRFGHSGWLWHNAFMLYDQATDSLWHHQSGRALSGRFRGKVLGRLPTQQMTFAAWTREHPGTLVLPKPTDPSAPVDTDSYREHVRRISIGLQVEVPGAVRLYPLSEMPDGVLVEDELADVPVVVAGHAPSGGAFAYDRRVEGKVLSFVVDSTDDGRPLLREKGGARRWSLRTGRSLEPGGDHGTLRPVLSSLFEVASWSLQHPGGTVWRP